MPFPGMGQALIDYRRSQAQTPKRASRPPAAHGRTNTDPYGVAPRIDPRYSATGAPIPGMLGAGNVAGGGNAGASTQPSMGGSAPGRSWTAAVTPGARARTERMNELSQQAGGQNYTYGTGFPKEYQAAQSAAPVVEQYRKDLTANPLADTPELIDQRSQAYGQRADIQAWMDANKNAPKDADGMNVVDRFLAKQRPASASIADSPVLNTPDEDRRVAEAGYGGMKFDPSTTENLKAFEAGTDWAASGAAGLKDSKFETGTMEYGGQTLRPGDAINATRNREIAQRGYEGVTFKPENSPDLASLGAGSPFTGQGVTQLQNMPMSPATAESNRQINFEGSPLPAANAAQAESDQESEFLKSWMKTVGLR